MLAMSREPVHQPKLTHFKYITYSKIYYLQILVVAGDITREEVIQKIVDQTIEKFGQIDVLV